jgi:AcrR family transcriptional regulator
MSSNKVKSVAARSPQIDAIRFATYLAAAAQDVSGRKKGEKSRLRLLAAGAKLLDTIPYRDLGVEDVTTEAQLAKGTFYIYFKTKDIFLRELCEAYVKFELQTYPQGGGKASYFVYTRRWISWYERTFDKNVGVLRCLVQFGATDAETQNIWHQRNARLVDRAVEGWLRLYPTWDRKLARAMIRTTGGMLDQSLFERYNVQTGPGLDEKGDLEDLIDLHAFLNYRAMHGTNPSADEFPADSPIRKLILGK